MKDITNGLLTSPRAGNVPVHLKQSGFTFWERAVIREQLKTLNLFEHGIEDPISDSIHGYIKVSKEVVQLINTSPFLKAREKRQLAEGFEVHPGAMHSRFAHMLGVFHVMKLLLRSLIERGQLLHMQTTEPLKIAILAALLHDVGHTPFSHVSDRLPGILVDHEEMGAKLIQSDPIVSILRRSFRIDPRRVAEFLAPPEEGLAWPEDEILIALLDSAFDADRMDYLIRDSHHLGLPYGVDIEGLAMSLVVIKWEGKERIVLDSKGIPIMQAILHARRDLYASVIMPIGSRSAILESMIARAMQDGLQSGNLTAMSVWNTSDNEAKLALMQAEMPESTQMLGKAVYYRRPHKSILQISNQSVLFQRIVSLRKEPVALREFDLLLSRSLERKWSERPVTLFGKKKEAIFKEYDVLAVIPDKGKPLAKELMVYWKNLPLGRKPLEAWEEVSMETLAYDVEAQERNRFIQIVISDDLNEARRYFLVHQEMVEEAVMEALQKLELHSKE